MGGTRSSASGMPTAVFIRTLPYIDPLRSPSRPDPGLRLGFIALADAAPIIAAHELGFFEQEGLRVLLSRELGWASIRDKILYHELDAAHALGAMPLAATMGVGSPTVPCVAAGLLSVHGNAITVAQRHWDSGVRDEADLANLIQLRSRTSPMVFGVAFPTSSHRFILRRWLRSMGVDPDRDVRVVVLPPPQVCRNLAAGTIDGYCIGEPWNSLAVQRRVGWIPAVSAVLAPEHPEKVLMLRRDYMDAHPEVHAALMRALDAASHFCRATENREQLAALLARPEYLNCAPEILLPAFTGPFDFGNGRVRYVPDLHRFPGPGLNRPDLSAGEWFLDCLTDSGLIDSEGAKVARALLGEVYRPSTVVNA